MKANFALIFVLVCLVLITACKSITDVEYNSRWIRVILDSPLDDIELTEGDITFCWHLENAKEGVEYSYVILFDKGFDPFDRRIETYAEVGEATEYTKKMSELWWRNFQWGVRVESSDGKMDESEVRTLKIRKK